MAATKVQANWASVAHGSTTITRVTSVNFNQGGSLASFAGDGDRFDTVICNLMNKPSASVTTADAAVVMGIAPGTVASFSATHKDAARAAGGDILYVLTNAVAENATTTGAYGQFGNATITFKAYSSDGTTNPLAFTRA